MFNKLCNLIDLYDESTDEKMFLWNEIVSRDAMSILDNFSEKDWNLLLNSIYNKSDTWKERLVYCLRNKDNDYQKKIIMKIIDTKNVDLFKKTMYVIISVGFIFNYDDLEEISKKIYAFINYFDEYNQDILISFLKKNNINEMYNFYELKDNLDNDYNIDNSNEKKNR